MEKRLIVVGNSLAFVVDKSIRKVLGIGMASRLSVCTDGTRLIVEVLPTEPLRASSSPKGQPLHIRRVNALRICDALVQQGLDNDRCIRLTGFRYLVYRPKLEIARTEDAKLRAAMDRLDICIDALNAGSSWEQAIAAAISAVPAVDEPGHVSAARPR